ncbi:MAG: ribosomal RNA small subunit methyltransferase A, partial [Deltaproteobacteria bacterium]|nr:ribosomal RNA small subunit methyltransferase A [Deltaproteobacteria bacterium]
MATSKEIRRILTERGLAPKKWMGQNLLVDTNYLGKIVDAAGIRPGEPVVEVGAGLGVLTTELLRRGAKVCALEIDAGFFRFLEEKLGASPAVELIHADALRYDFAALAARIG